MDVEQFVLKLKTDLDTIPEERWLAFVKERIKSIDSSADRALVETLFEIGCNCSRHSPRNIVVLIHGIRTAGQWQERLRSLLLKSSNDIKVFSIGYGYLDVFRFWFPWYFRKTPIERVCRELRGIQSEYRNDNITIVAHSYGTYVVAKILKENTDIKLHRMLLCGSVVSGSFVWDKVVGLPPDERFVNDCGNKDIWPVIAKSLSWGYGSTGTFGFKTHCIYDRYHDLGHSDFFEPEFMSEFWLPFLLQGAIIKSKWEEDRPNPSYGIQLIDSLPIKTLIVLFVIYLLGGFEFMQEELTQLITIHKLNF